MQTTLLGTYSNGIIELDEPVEEENGHRVAVVFLDGSKTKEKASVKVSVNRMCGGLRRKNLGLCFGRFCEGEAKGDGVGGMSDKFVIDSCAMIAFLYGEPGKDVVKVVVDSVRCSPLRRPAKQFGGSGLSRQCSVHVVAAGVGDGRRGVCRFYKNPLKNLDFRPPNIILL